MNAAKDLWRLFSISVLYGILYLLGFGEGTPWLALAGAVAVYVTLALLVRRARFQLFLKPLMDQGKVLRGADLRIHAFETPEQEDLDGAAQDIGGSFVWIDVTVTPCQEMAKRPWQPSELCLVSYDTRVRPSFDAPPKLGFVEHMKLHEGDKTVAHPQRFRGSKRLRLLFRLDLAGSTRARFEYFFETLGDFEVPASSLLSVDPMEGIHQQRGLGCGESEAEMLLVKAPVETVARALAEIHLLKNWRKDVWGVDTRVEPDAIVVFRIRGHDWTTVGAAFPTRRRIGDRAADLSRRLSTEVIYLGNSDTAGVIEYMLFEDGRRVEAYYSGEGREGLDDYELFEEHDGVVVAFSSATRKVEVSELGRPEFVDDFLRRHDAFAPPEVWALDSEASRTDGVVRLELAGLTESTCERLDFLAA